MREAQAREAEEKRRREIEQRRLAAKKAEEFHGTYRESAKNLSTAILHVLSVLETGVNYQEYMRLVGEANFELKKVETALPDGVDYESLAQFRLAIAFLEIALDSWKLKIESPKRSAPLDDNIQKSWIEAHKAYDSAMALLGAGK